MRKRRSNKPATIGNYIMDRIDSSSLMTTPPTRLEIARAALAKAVQPKTGALQSSPLKDDSNSRLPRYNPSKHKAGDKVLIFRDGRWLPYLVPDMDSSGQEIPDYF